MVDWLRINVCPALDVEGPTEAELIAHHRGPEKVVEIRIRRTRRSFGFVRGLSLWVFFALHFVKHRVVPCVNSDTVANGRVFGG